MTPIANILQPLIDVFESILIFFHDTVGFGWGFAIIAMTVVVRAALVPLTYKQLKSMQALQRLQPQLKELQAKYKDDKQRLQQETMKFYQEHKVNPFGACLPLVLQMPVFIALFYMLRKDLRHDICPDINPPGSRTRSRAGPPTRRSSCSSRTSRTRRRAAFSSCCSSCTSARSCSRASSCR